MSTGVWARSTFSRCPSNIAWEKNHELQDDRGGMRPDAGPAEPGADSAVEIARETRAALAELTAENAAARALAAEAKAVQVFPDVVKFGLLVGGQDGEGALIRGGKIAGYYRTTAASFGLQAGVQKFGYLLLLMSDKALSYLD